MSSILIGSSLLSLSSLSSMVERRTEDAEVDVQFIDRALHISGKFRNRNRVTNPRDVFLIPRYIFFVVNGLAHNGCGLRCKRSDFISK